MFKFNKKIKQLEGRITALENEMSLLLSLSQPSPEENGKGLSYEEVIDLWLNGKTES
ncbi:MAG: hypothetical protein J6B29_03930 [Clostridia bacterium]|nr:hypothetical protein [Clostridia bacterium]